MVLVKDKDFRINHYKKCEKQLHELRKIITHNEYLEIITKRMINEIEKNKNCFKKYPGHDDRQPKNIDELFIMILEVITSAPEYYTDKNPFNGLPLLNLFVDMMVNKNGMLFFGNIIINKYLKRILDLWKELLDHKSSCYVLPDNGWLTMNNLDEYEIDKNDKYYGFKSWNDFFIRKFKDMDKLRPISNSLVISPCDFHIIDYKKDLKYHGDFTFIKGDKYSVSDILEGTDKKILDKFIGGTLIQGFLNAENYHRYHAPVTGKLVSAHIANGSYYYILNYKKKFCGQKQLINSEEFLSNIQNRAIFIFKTQNIGYVAMICIGMIEVSSCIIHHKLIGKNIKKGEEIGYFQYGGSTIALMFEEKHCNKLKFHVKTKGYNLKTERLTKVRSKFADLK